MQRTSFEQHIILSLDEMEECEIMFGLFLIVPRIDLKLLFPVKLPEDGPTQHIEVRPHLVAL